MRFKIDENLPVEIAEMLNNAGYDSKSVNDEGLQGVKDSFLIDICKKENRILWIQTFLILEITLWRIFQALLF
jgi:predicted nuclease of predicted toxin-antitoxin system